jgi:ATP-dependent Clp protease adaptor protein ClpS
MGTDLITERERVTHSRFLSGWSVLLWNDDVHDMEYVVRALIQTIPMDPEHAVEVMFEAHHNGKAVAWSGAKEVAELYRDGLESYGLTATVSD